MDNRSTKTESRVDVALPLACGGNRSTVVLVCCGSSTSVLGYRARTPGCRPRSETRKKESTAAWTAQPLWCYKERTLYSAAGTPLGQFRSRKFYKRTVDFSLHRIFERMYEALNIDKKIKLITQFRRNRRDESFKPN
jgi:hypothetical protein